MFFFVRIKNSLSLLIQLKSDLKLIKTIKDNKLKSENRKSPLLSLRKVLIVYIIFWYFRFKIITKI